MNINYSVKKLTLPNGLTVILEENHATPVISLHLGVKIGSIWEREKEAGLSHVLEHMLFKGTKNFSPGEIASKVESCGGEINAFTSFDHTVYYINLPSQNWETGLTLLQEMAFEATLDSVELSRELEVILEELRRGEDNPHHQLSQNLFSESYGVHPYGRPIIGYADTIKSFTREDVFGFYKKWYCANNMCLSVCGDFKEGQIYQVITKIFGAYPFQTIETPKVQDPDLQTTPRFAQKKAPIQGEYLEIGFPVPSIKHPDIVALDLLAHLLGYGETSRLEQIVKEKKQLALSIHSVVFSPKSPGLFLISATSVPQGTNHLVGAILEEVEFCKNHFFTQEEISRAKLNIKSSIYYEKETCEGTSKKWLIYDLLTGDPSYEKTYLLQVEKTSAEDIQKVAQKYLVLSKATTSFLTSTQSPLKLNKKLFAASNKKNQKKSSSPEIVQNIQKFSLPHGVDVIILENKRLPLISMRLASYGGTRFETKNNNGISHLVCSVLEKGTLSKTSLEVSKITEQMAGNLSAYTGRNTWGLQSSFLSEKSDLGMDLFFDTLLNPAFNLDEIKKEKQATLHAIKNQEDSPAYLAFYHFQKELFKKHPYGLPVLGTKKTVSGLLPRHITQFYSQLMDPKNITLSIVGDVDSQAFIKRIEPYLGLIKNKGIQRKKLTSEKPPQKIERLSITQKKQQAHLVLGFLATTVFKEDRYAFEVLNNILAGQGGRLFLELRDKKSLAYTVSSSLVSGIEAGFFSIYMGTEPKKVDTAIEGILTELRKMIESPVSDLELGRAKQYLIGNYQLDHQRNSAIASTLAFNNLFGYPLLEYQNYPLRIEKVTKEDVLEVARHYLKLNAYTLAIVRP